MRLVGGLRHGQMERFAGWQSNSTPAGCSGAVGEVAWAWADGWGGTAHLLGRAAEGNGVGVPRRDDEVVGLGPQPLVADSARDGRAERGDGADDGVTRCRRGRQTAGADRGEHMSHMGPRYYLLEAHSGQRMQRLALTRLAHPLPHPPSQRTCAPHPSAPSLHSAHGSPASPIPSSPMCSQ